jgi:hypothetical protein
LSIDGGGIVLMWCGAERRSTRRRRIDATLGVSAPSSERVCVRRRSTSQTERKERQADMDRQTDTHHHTHTDTTVYLIRMQLCLWPESVRIRQQVDDF